MKRKRKGYRNLHLHTDASHLDGMNDLKSLIKRLKEIGHDACAITDHGVMHNALAFYRICLENDIKPIIGFEAYTFYDRRLQKKEDIEKLVELLGDDFVRQECHLVLLAENFKGYQSLLRLTSIGYTQGMYKRPHIDFNDLKEHSEGVICINGHIGTDLAKAIERDEIDRAYALNEKYLELFGDRYYLEIQNHGLEVEKKVNPVIIEMSQKTGVPLVMTNDSHYTWKDDADAHRVHFANGIGKTLDEFYASDYEGFATCDEFYVKSDDEMYEIAEKFGDYAIQALENTLDIVERCNVEIPAIVYSRDEHDGKIDHSWKPKEYLFPDFPIPAPYSDAESYFRFLAMDGLEKRRVANELYIGNEEKLFTFEDYKQRLEYEMGVIVQMGFPTYFLILWDVIDFCHRRGISVGKGRGSGAGSLVAYSLKITDVDPLQYDLLFERFLNPARISLPDIDTDFDMDQIQEVIQYTREKYGEDHVCIIGTFGSLSSRAVLKDVARVMQYPYDKINSLTKQVVETETTIDKIVEQYKTFQDQLAEDKDFQKIIKIARRLEGLQRHTSKHAAGVIISPFSLTDLIPVKGTDVPVSQFDMGDCELLGFVKMDYLKLRTLTIIRHTLESIKRQAGEALNINKINFEDPLVFEEFQKGNSLGIFQFESDGMQALLKRHRPKSIDDLTADNALYRPGPIDSKIDDPDDPNYGKTMLEVFLDRVNGVSEVAFDHSSLEAIQKATYGVFVYQEQLMQGSVALAGYTMSQADELRKVVGKKQLEKIPKQREKFVHGCLSHPPFIEGCELSGKETIEVAEKIWKQIETFGRYGFNRSHSCAYAILAYQSMYLKVYYPVHFMAAVLTSWMGKKIEQIIPYLNGCRNMGIKILPPDINQSSDRFEVSQDGEGIHFGLTGINGVGEKAVQSILEMKRKYQIKTLADFILLKDRSINSKVITSLIKCGAFDFLGYNRRTLLQSAEDLLAIHAKIKQRIAGNKKRKTPVQDISTFYEPLYEYQIQELEEFPYGELCQMERELTGFYMAHHPLEGLISYIQAKTTHSSEHINKGVWVGYDEDAEEDIYLPLGPNRTVITGGVIKQCKEIPIKKGRHTGKNMLSFIIEDAYQGDINCTAFVEVYEKYKTLLTSGKVVFIKGYTDYYRDTPQVRVNAVAGVDRDSVTAKIQQDELLRLQMELSKIENAIQLCEDTLIALLGDDEINEESMSIINDELESLYNQKLSLEEAINGVNSEDVLI